MKPSTAVFTLAFIGFIGYGLWAGRDPGPVYPERATDEQKQQILKLHKIKREDRYFVEVSEEWMGQRLMIKYQPASFSDGTGWVRSFFFAAENLMGNLQKIAPNNGYKQIMFDVQLPTVSRLGEKGHSRGMLVQYNWDELKGAHWENLTGFDMGELPEKISFQRLGKESAIEYCSNGDNAKFAPKFCLLALQ